MARGLSSIAFPAAHCPFPAQGDTRYPEAHDNDAERAARAGLAILDAISKLNEHPTHPKLSARIGIDSGAVVVGAGAGGDADVFGDTPNIAARVQAAAASGTVLISADTHRLVSRRTRPPDGEGDGGYQTYGGPISARPSNGVQVRTFPSRHPNCRTPQQRHCRRNLRR
jgi:class 3 adenylate cyclase